MKPISRLRRTMLSSGWLLAAAIGVQSARADCTLTNTGVIPLNELGFKVYGGFTGGLYPYGDNTRPPAHEAAGIAIATQIQPLDGAGNVDTNTGKIVLLSLGMSNTTQEWATKGTAHFTAIMTNDPSLNPRVQIVDGAISGQDAVDWTNASAPTWDGVITQRLVLAGATTNQVQVMWLKQALAQPQTYGTFPGHAQALQDDLAIILRNAKAKYPNLKLVYISCRTRAYTNAIGAANPEPFAFETAFADKWVIQDQLFGLNNLNYNPSNGPVVAPWISWGPYIWADGTVPRADGFTWVCLDTEPIDFTHPTAGGGVPKVAQQLRAFFKTDATTTPWFLREGVIGLPPTCAPTADVTNGVMPLTVHFTANASDDGPIQDYQWTFEDGEFSTNANPAKVFPTPGIYHARLTVTDTNGNTAQGSVTIKVKSTVLLWREAKFIGGDLTNALISGDDADPDGDGLKNLLEYVLGTAPKAAEVNALNFSITNGLFQLMFPHFKPAADAVLEVEVSNDLLNWTVSPPRRVADEGVIEKLAVQESVSTNTARFFRLKATLP